MYSFNGETSSSDVSTKTFQKHTVASKETVYNMEEGEPFYLFQWHLNCFAKDGAFVDSFSNVFYSHDKITHPPPLGKMNAEQCKNLIVK